MRCVTDSPKRRRGPGCGFLVTLGLLPLMLGVQSTVVESFLVPSGSMEPTLRIGDRILAWKFAYGLRVPFTRISLTGPVAPERGDIVVFVRPGSRDPDAWTAQIDIPSVVPSEDYVKRVVAVPGDTVAVRDGRVVVNGKGQGGEDLGPYRFVDGECDAMQTRRRSETLGSHDYVVLQAAEPGRRRADWGPKKVPKGKVAVLGDNRDRSKDSRSIGFVPIDLIKGKAVRIGLSVPACTTGDALPEIRWQRMGQALE